MNMIMSFKDWKNVPQYLIFSSSDEITQMEKGQKSVNIIFSCFLSESKYFVNKFLKRGSF